MASDTANASSPVEAGDPHVLLPNNLLLGTALMLGAMVLLPLMDGLAKGLSERYSVMQVAWARYVFHLLCMVPILLLRFEPRALVPQRLPLQLVRGSLLLSATVLFFFALSTMPQATVLAIFFVSPAVVTVLAPALLGERVGTWRVVAVIAGFLGVLLILRPGSGLFGWGAIFALGAGVMHGFYMVFTRRLSRSAPPLVTLGYTAVIGAVVLSVMVPFFWLRPTLSDLGIMVLLGILAAAGHFLLIKAFDYAPASWLAPLGYAEIVTAVIFGYLAYSHLPDALTWVGIAIIIGAGVWISLWERRMVTGKISRQGK